MIPDKIYVAESLIKTPYGNEWSPTPYISRENTEYIRKDALMEWIEGKQNVLDLHDEYEAGRYDVLEELGNKLNSM